MASTAIEVIENKCYQTTVGGIKIKVEKIDSEISGDVG
jgi:hypothetical protein